MWSVITIGKKSTITRCLTVLIGVFYVLHKAVDLSIMWILIIHSINCPFHLLYCAICTSLYNVFVLIHDCNVIKFQGSICSYFKYYQKNSPTNHSHKDVFLRTYSYIETFEDRGKINYDMFLSVAFLNLHLPLFSLDAFYDAKIELKIYHYLILIQTNITFSLLFFSYFHLLIQYYNQI